MCILKNVRWYAIVVLIYISLKRENFTSSFLILMVCKFFVVFCFLNFSVENTEYDAEQKPWERDPSLVPDCNSEVFRLVLSSVVLDVGFSEMTFIITVRHFLLFLIWWLIIVMSNYPTIEIVIHFVLHSVNPYEHYWFLKINLKLHDFTKCFYDSYCISTSSHEFSVYEVISFHLQVEDSNSSFLVFSTTVRICGPNSPVL